LRTDITRSDTRPDDPEFYKRAEQEEYGKVIIHADLVVSVYSWEDNVQEEGG
jgi:hypothetical protein